MFQCYVDESGNNQGPVMVMLGVVSDADSWDRFSREWQECLDMHPQMKALHMTDLMHRESDASYERAARFYRIFCDHIKGCVVVSIPLADYHEVFANAHPLFKNPYFFLFFSFIRSCRQHSPGVGADDEIEFIFDEQNGVMRKLAEGWTYYGENHPATLAFLGDLPSFKNDEQVLPLQASDFMAWLFRRSLANEIDGKPNISVPWNFRDEIPYFWAKYDRTMLQAEYELMTATG